MSADVWLQGLIGLITNPVLADGIAGLATSATAQATIQARLTFDSLLVPP